MANSTFSKVTGVSGDTYINLDAIRFFKVDPQQKNVFLFFYDNENPYKLDSVASAQFLADIATTMTQGS